MSRSPSMSARDDVRSPEPTVSRGGAEARAVSVPLDRLTLRPGRERQPILHRDRTYSLRDSDVRTLATVGTFRVVRAAEVQAMHSSRDAWTGDLRHLREQGLVEVKTVTINREPAAVAVLTRQGKSLLDAHQDRSNGRPSQAYHAGLVKPRELAHDAQLYALFQAEASRIQADGGRVDPAPLD